MGLLYDIEKMMQKEIPELETELSVSIERVQRGERRRFGRAVAAAKASGREDRKKSATRRSGRVKEEIRDLEAKKPETKSEKVTFERKSVKTDRFSVKKNEEKLRKLKDQKKASQKKTGFEKFYKKNGDIFEEATKAFEKKQKNHSGKKIKEETGKKKEHKRRAS
jgi:ATP-dependent RNA helicase RhlE